MEGFGGCKGVVSACFDLSRGALDSGYLTRLSMRQESARTRVVLDVDGWKHQFNVKNTHTLLGYVYM